MKKIISLALIFLLCLSLIGCGSNGKKPVVNGDESLDIREPISRKDENDLMEVVIKDGEALAYFDFQKWESFYTITDYIDIDVDELHDGPFSIRGLSGPVKDCIISYVMELDYINGIDETFPSVFFLMEDGTIEWTLADAILNHPEDSELVITGKIPWLENIESLSMENSGEGMGEMRAYGTDSLEDKYDLGIAAQFTDLFYGAWSWDLPPGDYDMGFGVFEFLEDGSLTYQIGNADGSNLSTYSGNYWINLLDDDMGRPGLLYLNLDLLSNDSPIEVSEKISASFFTQVYGLSYLSLWPSEGDSLYVLENNFDFMEYNFYQGYNIFSMEHGGELSSSELYLDYLMKWVPEARKMVEEYGMELLVTDDYTEFEYEDGRELWLGTDHGDKFTKEILYAITDSGTIYEFDPIGDGWILRWVQTYD